MAYSPQGRDPFEKATGAAENTRRHFEDVLSAPEEPEMEPSMPFKGLVVLLLALFGWGAVIALGWLGAEVWRLIRGLP